MIKFWPLPVVDYPGGIDFNCADNFASEESCSVSQRAVVSLPRGERDWLARNKTWSPYFLSCRGRLAKWFRRRLPASTRCRAWDNRALCTPASRHLPREPSCRSRSPLRWCLAVLPPPKTRSANAEKINYSAPAYIQRARGKRIWSVTKYTTKPPTGLKRRTLSLRSQL